MNRRKRNRNADIVLDFTSLLDVTLIILFFFIMFSNFESDSKMKEADAKMAEAEAIAADTGEKLAAAEEKSLRLEEELLRLKETDENSAELLRALDEMEQGNNIKIFYRRVGDGWSLTFTKEEKELLVIDDPAGAEEKFVEMLRSQGYTRDSVIICEFIYSRSEYYIKAQNTIPKMTETAREHFDHLLISYTNTDI